MEVQTIAHQNRTAQRVTVMRSKVTRLRKVRRIGEVESPADRGTDASVERFLAQSEQADRIADLFEDTDRIIRARIARRSQSSVPVSSHPWLFTLPTLRFIVDVQAYERMAATRTMVAQMVAAR